MRIAHLIAAVAAVALSPVAIPSALAQTVLFQDAFTTAASAANYTAVTSGQTAVTHAFDYSGLGIPTAPSSGDATTFGLKLEANMSAGAIAAVTLHTVTQFTGDYTVKFDMWINANGPLSTSVGSTQMLTAGVGGNAVAVNGSTSSSVPQTGSGGWTAVTGEGGAAVDFRMVKGAADQGVATNQFAAGTAAAARDGANAYYAQFTPINIADLPVQGANNGGSPAQTGSTPAGSVGFAWRAVELRVDANAGTGGAPAMEWYIDGLRIGTLDAGASGAFVAAGSATIGYWDPFASISSDPTYSFGLVDNLRVLEAAPTTDADFDNDSDVDGADFLTWQQGLGVGTTNAQGDANASNTVDAADLVAWSAAFGPPALPAVGAVPEPAAFASLSCCVMALAAARRRRSPLTRRNCA